MCYGRDSLSPSLSGTSYDSRVAFLQSPVTPASSPVVFGILRQTVQHIQLRAADMGLNDRLRGHIFVPQRLNNIAVFSN